MKLYHRLIIAMVLAATAGATTLVVLLAFPWAPLTAWAVLAGVLTAGAVLVARWAMGPLRQLVGEISADNRIPSRDLLDRVTDTIGELRLALEKQAGSEQTGHQPWHAVQQGLTLLFNTVTADSLTLQHHRFVAPILSEWVREGQTAAAALLWDGDHPVTFFGNGSLSEYDLPEKLTTLPRIASQPILHTENGSVWAGFPIAKPATGKDTQTPRLLVAAWPDSTPPSEPLLAGMSAVAHYLGLRATALNGVEALPVMDTEHAIKADYLAHVQQQLAQSIKAMSEYSRQLTEAEGQPTDHLLEQADRLLARISSLIDLTTVRWNPPRTPLERLNVTTLIEQVVARHAAATSITLARDEHPGTAPVMTEPMLLSSAVNTLIDMANHTEHHRITVSAQQSGPDTAPRGEFTIRSSVNVPTSTPTPPPEPSPLPDPHTDIDVAFVSQLVRLRGGHLAIEQESDGGMRYTLNWPYTSSPVSGPNRFQAA